MPKKKAVKQQRNRSTVQALHVQFGPDFMARWNDFRDRMGYRQKFAVERALTEFMEREGAKA